MLREDTMKQALFFVFASVLLIAFSAPSMATHETKKPAVLNLSDDEQVELARSAAPASISKNASIIILNWNGQYKTVRSGSNGFTCYSDLDKIDVPVPSCMNEAAIQWWDDFTSGKPGPTNKVPGIAYMAKGALRWEKDGKIYMDWHTPGAHRVTEPPHWLVLWPFDHITTGLPTYPGKFGSSIMYHGTPWSHLMIYKDPMLIDE